MNANTTITLNNEKQMPVFGYGVWMIEDPAVCEAGVLAAIEAGYKLIDTAAVYLNEKAVGAALKKSPTPREELFITTKLWVQDMGYEQTKAAFEKSMHRLQLDYFDMYMIHWPFGDYMGSWKAMEEFYKAGRVKTIGVCNFPEYQTRNLMANAEIKPAVNQVECHPWFQQKELANYLKKAGIAMQSYSPLGHGKSELLNDALLAGLAKKYNQSVAQVILRWQVQEGFCPIPKSANQDRIKENISIFDFQLTEDDMEAIRKMDKFMKLGSGNPNDPVWEKKLSKFKVDI